MGNGGKRSLRGEKTIPKSFVKPSHLKESLHGVKGRTKRVSLLEEEGTQEKLKPRGGTSGGTRRRRRRPQSQLE